MTTQDQTNERQADTNRAQELVNQAQGQLNASRDTSDGKLSDKMDDAAGLRLLSNADVVRRFESLESRMGVVAGEIVSNTEITADTKKLAEQMSEDVKTVKTDMTSIKESLVPVKEMVNIFSDLKGGIRVMGLIGKGGGFVGKVVAALVAVYAAIYAIAHNLAENLPFFPWWGGK